MGRGEPGRGLTSLASGRWGKLLLRLGASVLVLAVVAWVVDPQRALEGLARLRPLVWVTALAAFLALHALSAQKWRWFVALSGTSITARTALTSHAAGLFANLCLPSLIGGDVLRAGLAMRTTPDKTQLVVGSLVDRVADLTALVAIALTATVFVGASDRIPLHALPIAAGLLALGAVTGALTLRFVVRSRLVRRLPRKLARRVLEVSGAARAMGRRPLRSAGGWVACVAIQSGFVLVNMTLGESLGLHLSAELWFLLWPLAKVAAMLPLSFGGLGVREAAFAALVAPFGPESLAVAQSLVWQSVLIVGGLSAGGFWMASSRGGGVRSAEA